MERRRRDRQDRPARLHRPLPDRDLDVLRERRTPPPSTGSSPPTRRARLVGPAVRQQLQRLRHVCRRLPAGVRRDHQPRVDAIQRRSATRGRTPAARSSSRTRSSTTTRTASTPTPRSTATRRPRRTAPARTTGSAPSPTPIPAGCSCTTTCTTTTTPTFRKAGNAVEGPLGTGMTVSGGATTPSWTTRSTNNGAWGVLFVPFPDNGKPDLKSDLQRHGRHADLRVRLCLRGLRQRVAAQHVQRTTASSAIRRTPTTRRSSSTPVSHVTASPATPHRRAAHPQALSSRSRRATARRPSRPASAIC